MHEPKASALGSRGRYCSSESTKKSRKSLPTCGLNVLVLSVTFRQSDSGCAKCTLATSRFSSLGHFERATLTSAHAECASGGSPLLLTATTRPVGSETGCLHAT